MKKVLKWVLPAVPLAVVVLFMVIIECGAPGSFQAFLELSEGVNTIAMYSGIALAALYFALSSYGDLISERIHKRHIVTVQLDHDVFVKLQAEAESECCTVAEVVAYCMDYFVEVREFPSEEVESND